MSRRLTRRAFIGITSGAALGISTRGNWLRAQSNWTLAAEVIPVKEGFGLMVTFAVEFLDLLPLYIQFADRENPDVFLWDQITVPSGTDLLEIGPYDIPYGGSYLVTVVTALGQQHTLSPVVQVDVPSLPQASF